MQQPIATDGGQAMSLYGKNAFGRRYVRLMTGSPWPYLSFLAGMTAVFLALTLSIRVDQIRTYPAKWIIRDGTPVLAVESASVPSGQAFLYANKNEKVLVVRFNGAERERDGTLLVPDEGQDLDALLALGGDRLYLDVPDGKATLLYLLLVKGGKGGG